MYYLDKLVDCKYFASRLLGLNSLFDKPGCIIEIELDRDIDNVASIFVNNLSRVLDEVNEFKYQIKKSVYSTGFQVGISAPYDLIYVLCSVMDEVWESTAHALDNAINIDFNRLVNMANAYIKQDINLLVRKIAKTANARKVNFFINNDIVYLGSGKYGYAQKINKIKKINDIPWEKIKDVPIALVTGTNGKTTTTRLTEFICRKSGLKSGYCSSDWVMNNGKIVTKGDFSGPMGHHLVLSNPKLDVAILEVARGGILKRGILPNYTVSATVTNISQDHLGDSGIENLDDLARLKGLIYNSLLDTGCAIINLDDEHIRKLNILHQVKCYLSTKLSEEEISTYLTQDNFVVFIDGNDIILKLINKRYIIANLLFVPLTIHGLAKYNYENILHAVALSYSLGIKPSDIKAGLLKFASNNNFNYGRWNYFFSKKHGHIVVDLAHNPAGLNSVLALARDFKNLFKLSGKLVLMYGVTADRRDTIPEVINVINSYAVDDLVIKDFVFNLRGSKLGEIPNKLYNALLDHGYPKNKLRIILNELDAAKYLVKRASSNDLTILCTHENISKVIKIIKQNS